MRHSPVARALTAAATATLLGLGLAGLPMAPAAAAPDLTRPLTREPVKAGDADLDQWHIAHVLEVQIRLHRLGHLTTAPHGRFDPRTERAVKSFQRARGLRPTGRVNLATWRPLIRRSTFGLRKLPSQCRQAGWRMCYDRKRHQATLLHNGRLHNSWLVRGGSYDAQTRVGDFEVGWRSEDHRSRTFDNAPMPYSQFFSGGQALHGSRNMMDPFEGHSHGCVNFWVEDARQLWNLTYDKRLFVHVYGAWD